MPYKNRVAVVGAGLTKFMRRALETSQELAFEGASGSFPGSRPAWRGIPTATGGVAVLGVG